MQRPELRTASAHVFVTDLDRPTLEPDDRHHLERALRLRPGEIVTVSDGSGAWRPCRFGPELDPLAPTVREVRPDPEITIGFAPVKGERPEWVVQKLTELGVDRIVPLRTARSVVRWSAGRAEHHHARLDAIARSAAMQSRRVFLPKVEPVAAVRSFLGEPGAAIADPAGEPITLQHPILAIGPEGGWDEDELVDHPLVSTGPAILRSETAAIVAGALLVALRSGTVRTSDPTGGD